jgi:glutamyl-tRNA synthetase
VPLILGTDKARLSKRHGATSVTAYRDMGYFSEAVVNYLVRLAWSHGDQEIFSRQELIEKFSLDNIGKSAGVFNPEKFLWVNFHYLKSKPLSELAEAVKPYIAAKGYPVPQDNQWLEKMIKTLQERAQTLVELVDAGHYFFTEEVILDEKAAKKFLTNAARPSIASLKAELASIEDFTHANIEQAFASTLQKCGLKMGELAQPVRVALTGSTMSPGIHEVIEVLGKARTLHRLQIALKHIEELG